MRNPFRVLKVKPELIWKILEGVDVEAGSGEAMW